MSASIANFWYFLVENLCYFVHKWLNLEVLCFPLCRAFLAGGILLFLVLVFNLMLCSAQKLFDEIICLFSAYIFCIRIKKFRIAAILFFHLSWLILCFVLNGHQSYDISHYCLNTSFDKWYMLIYYIFVCWMKQIL